MISKLPLAVVKRAREQHRPEGPAVLAILNELKGLVATRTDHSCILTDCTWIGTFTIHEVWVLSEQFVVGSTQTGR